MGHTPLSKAIWLAISDNILSTVDLHALFDVFFSQVGDHLTKDNTGLSAFKHLTNLVMDYFDTASQGVGYGQLQTFHESSETPLCLFFRAFRCHVACTVGERRTTSPRIEVVIEIVRTYTTKRWSYPVLIPSLFPGDLSAKTKSYAAIAGI